MSQGPEGNRPAATGSDGDDPAIRFRDRVAKLPPDRVRLLALELQSRLDALESARSEPIAIVGMGCRFPGGADNPEAFWKLLAAGVDAITEAPAERWAADSFFDRDPEAPGKGYTNRGGFLAQIDRFSPGFFGIPPREAVSLDPQQRLFLEVAWEALEDAGQPPDRLAGSPTGVFAGIGPTEYPPLHPLHLEAIDAYTCIGNAHSVVANRISYQLDLRGPSMALDTACSSSLVAIHLACESLRRGESRLAIAGGVYLILSPLLTISLGKAHLMAPDGHCKTFDSRADGYVRGEGCGVIVLKRLSDARADGDRILALVRGSAVGQDGRGNGLTAPNMFAQQAVIREVLANAGLAPEQISYVEAHGTGTTVGDVIELEALKSIYGKPRAAGELCAIASVKTNIGHLEPAAGIAGVIKVVLALQHETIPPHLHFRELNPDVSLDGTPFVIPTEAMPWPRGGRCAGISSFGMGGTCSHMVVEEAPAGEEAAHEETAGELLCLSAKSPEALREMAQRYAGYLGDHPEIGLRDACFTAAVGRSHFDHRAALVAAGDDEARHHLAAVSAGLESRGVATGQVAGEKPKIAFLFTGQGSQYPQMGRQLYATEPTFRRALDTCAELLAPRLPRPLLSVLFPEDDDAGLLDETAYTQPALFALEYALVELWRSWGIEPAAVMGHSIGEVAAAFAAGVFTLEDGLALIAERGRLMGGLPPGGAMAAVFADEARIAAAVDSRRDLLAVAAVNAAREIVISGAQEEVEAVLGELAAEGIKGRRLAVSHAFHSPLMEPIAEAFEAVAVGVEYSPPKIGIVSNLTGAWVTPDEVASAGYWCRHLRQPVRFTAGIEALRQQGFELFLEIGPQPALLGLGRKGWPDAGGLWLPSLRKGRKDRLQMLESLGALYCQGAEVDWERFYAGSPRRKVSLPTYPFERSRFWLEAADQRLSAGGDGWQTATARGTGHPLLGHQLRLPFSPDVRFESALSPGAPAYLGDHRLFGTVIVPAASHLAMALAAAEESFGAGELRQVLFPQALVLQEDGSRRVQLILSPEAEGRYSFSVAGASDGDGGDADSWSLYATGSVDPGAAEAPAPGTPLPPLDEIKGRCRRTASGFDFYGVASQLGYDYGPTFRWIDRIYSGRREALGQMRLPEPTDDAEAYPLFPGLLDSCLQLFSQCVEDWSATLEGGEWIHIPCSLERFRLHRRPRNGPLWCHVQLADDGGPEGDTKAGDLVGDATLFEEGGVIIAELERVELKRVHREALLTPARASLRDALYEPRWRAKARPDRAAEAGAEAPGVWLVLADRGGLGQRLADLLTERGDTCRLLFPGPGAEESADRPATFDPHRPEEMVQSVKDVAEDPQRPFKGVVHLWSLEARTAGEEPVLESLTAAQRLGCGSALRLVQALVTTAAGLRSAPRLWLVTRGAQALGGHPVAVAQAPLWGLGRVIALELPDLRCSNLDLEPGEGPEAAEELLAEILAGDREDQLAFRGGERYVARLVRHRPGAASVGELEVAGGGPCYLTLSSRGVLDNLTLAPLERRPPAAGEVEIRVRASGLNFRDVLNVLGEYPGDPGPLGGECTGEIVAVGEGVERFVAGDEVMAFAPRSFASFVTVDARFVAPKPRAVSFEEAATIPVAFLTAYYGLDRLARMSAGDRVLIHAAAGGVGMAAVHLAQRAGAEVFATASRGKWATLKSLGVEHVMDSRSLGFAARVMEITAGRGVDLVLNSLAGEFIAESFAALAPGGRFVEIGKRGIWDDRQVAALGKDLSYFPFDLVQVSQEQPDLVTAMLEKLAAGFDEGSLRPLTRQVYPLRQAVSAFRTMAQAKHKGKIVLTQPALSAGGTYLITGGLGALGLKVARWLAERSARHLVLMGRSAPSQDVQQTLAELEEIGAEVTVAQGDVAQEADLARILAQIDASLPPLRGVVHAAGVLDDGTVANQDWQRFAKVLAPKVEGAWNLHLQTADRGLDLFVLFSSAAGLLGAGGQGNYAAANSFLDALAHYRKARGLPAVSIDWGPWAEGGMADGVAGERWSAQGIAPISPLEGLDLLEEIALAAEVPQVLVLPVRWSQYLQQLQDRQPFLTEVAQRKRRRSAAAPRRSEILDQLAQAPAEDRRSMLVDHIRETIALILGFEPSHPLPIDQPLDEVGLDSLLAVELRNKLGLHLGKTLPATLLAGAPAIEELANLLLEELLPEEPSAAPVAEPALP